MLREYCSHCKGQARGTEQNPNFSIIESFYRGNPAIEVLKNGGPVHRHDEHFQFGCRKARILIACLPALKIFGWPSNAEDRTNFQAQIFTESHLGISIEVFATTNPNFVLSSGELIDRYWLDLREMPSLEIHKGLGVMKCRAVWSVQDQILA